MRPVGAGRLIAWMLREREKSGSIFGIPEEAIRRARPGPPGVVLGESCGLPLGPAAGPHTQMAQNIVASYLCGARYVELKTVQVRDRLEIPKPCIDARDEGYNSEWSQELSLEEAFGEYLLARLVVQALPSLLGTTGEAVFAMSVGYDLEGIRSPRVDAFIERMRAPRVDSFGSRLYDSCLTALARAGLSLPPTPSAVSRSVTLSTMHGCPAREIEEICRYLMQRKRLATLVKLNPTLVGLEEARGLFRGLEWGEIEPSPGAFEKDISFADAVAMVERLRELGRREGVGFGVKLSNTLGVANHAGVLPGDEIYLSGRALAPLTLLAASRLADSLGPDLLVSYSGGASEANLGRLLASGLRPVTVATELLKPGGYLRLGGMAAVAEGVVGAGLPERLDCAALRELAQEAGGSPLYRRSARRRGSSRIGGPLPLADCVLAPCVSACPIGQDVPRYIGFLRDGRAPEAMRAICRDNVLPGLTGWICDHPCMDRCTRADYEGPVLIRELKRIALERGRREGAERPGPEAPAGVAGHVAVIGGGPSGLAAASYLARCGVRVTILEKQERAGGVTTTVLPSYRLPSGIRDEEIAEVERLGVEIRRSVSPRFSFAALRAEGFTRFYVATGAEVPRPLLLQGESAVSALDFLRASNAAAARGELDRDRLGVGRRVAVIGGGNTAVDAARTARRVGGVEWVGIVYRRGEEEMPADREELDTARAEGVELLTLLSPIALSGGLLRCRRMSLGAPGPDGRRQPEPLAEEVALRVETVLSAVGEGPDEAVLKAAGLELEVRGTVVVDPRTQESSVADVFAGGDAVRGGGTVILAMADARRAAREIVRRLGVPWVVPEVAEANLRAPGSGARGRLFPSAAGASDEELATAEGARCLSCDQSCNRCIEVCPNRANVAIAVGGLRDRTQVVHIESLCNECGACGTFCLYDGLPYRDKLTLFSSREAYEASAKAGFFVGVEGEVVALRAAEGERENATAITRTLVRDHPYLLEGSYP